MKKAELINLLNEKSSVTSGGKNLTKCVTIRGRDKDGERIVWIMRLYIPDEYVAKELGFIGYITVKSSKSKTRQYKDFGMFMRAIDRIFYIYEEIELTRAF